jgi:hypothetical protein
VKVEIASVEETGGVEEKANKLELCVTKIGSLNNDVSEQVFKTSSQAAWCHPINEC